MFVRTWRGVVASSDADAYADYLRRTGIPDYLATPGNRGVYMLRRNTEQGCEFVMLTMWDSMDAIRAFAGDDVEQAVFYPEDDRFLIDRDLRVRHHEVLEHAAPRPSGPRH